ncbi:LysR family transcriptional regulator [Dehalobacter sp. DCM]|uniref:LysR family transcriptional regulator n=1 Tax=Dehalobacter sp. DCM TaxID=2907827 RepID=UPI003081BBA5|nr:LysR family transcriptional regulator [Dehalobacter sp. DCM]
MRTEHLEYLIEIAKTKSISHASKRLYVSHQGLSSAISLLEKELDVALLKRTYSGVELTEAGEKYVHWATRFLDELKDLRKETSAVKKSSLEKRLCTVNIYAAPLFFPYIIPRTVSEFKSTNPDVKLCLKEMDSLEIIEQLSEEYADIGLVSFINNNIKNIKEILKKKNLVLEKLFLTNVMVVAGKKSPLGSKKSISIKELLQCQLVVNNRLKSLINYLETYSDLYGEPQITLESDNFFTNTKTSAQGLMVNLTSEYNYKKNPQHFPDDISCIPISDDIKYYVGIITNKKKGASPAYNDFLNILKTHY